MLDPLEGLKTALADRYIIDREIGHGGSATIYLARERNPSRPVAIKVLAPELALAVRTERFLLEIQIAARLQHPHILTVHTSGEAAGLLYYVMPYVAGETLRDRLARTDRLPLDEAIRITQEVASALTYAHEQGVVHRDIKPATILMSAGHAMVADFGIARAFDAAGSSELTQTGVLGTPAYMSPEQASGQVVDGRSDIYSLGCVLYEMLSGRPPFTGPNARSLQAQHVVDPVPPLRRSRPDIPRHVARVLERALAKNPEERFSQAGEFTDALTSPDGWGWILDVFDDRRPGRRVTLTVVGLFVVCGIGWAAFEHFRSSSIPLRVIRPAVVVLPFDNLGSPRDAYFAEGLTDEITSRIAENAGLAVISRASAMHYSTRKMTIKEIARDLNIQYVLAGSIRTDRHPEGSGVVRVIPELTRVSDERLMWSGRYDAALAPGDIVAVQTAIASGVAEALNVRLLLPEQPPLEARPTGNLQAYDFYLRGNLYTRQFLVEDDTRRAVEMYERAIALDSNFALAYAKLAQARSILYYLFDRTDRQLQLTNQAVTRALALGPELPEARIALGCFYTRVRMDYERALEQFRLARERQPNNSELLWLIGSVERRQGKWDQALETLRRALSVNPRSHIFAFEVGATLHLMRRYSEAAPYYDQAAAFAPDWVPPLASKALLATRQGDLDGARQVMHEAARRFDVTKQIVPVLIGEISYRPLFAFLDQEYQLGLERFSLRTSRVDSGAYYLAKAELARRRGRLDHARAYYDSSRAVWQARTLVQVQQASPHIEFGMALAGLGRITSARREAAAAAALRPITHDALRGAFWTLELIRLYVAVGDQEAAIDQLKALLAIPAPISVPELRVDPTFDLLRSNPRFQALLAAS